jgi:transposase
LILFAGILLEGSMKNREDKSIVAGVDVASEELVVRISLDTKLLRFTNDPKGIRELIGVIRKCGVDLVVCEHTGRYEWELLVVLWKNKIPVHCAQPRAVHNFAKARKATAKSDPIDAETIMQYGLRMDLEPTAAPSDELIRLKELTARRDDLNGMLVQETNRIKAPSTSIALKKGIGAHIRYLKSALSKNAKEITSLIENNPSLKAPVECLDKEHGVGLVSAACIYASMPELGTLTRQTAGALAGLAPFLRESGKFSGHRKISGGRTLARNALYMVALTVIRKKEHVLRSFYLRLKKAGKHTSVALTAVMRKLIIRFNTKLKELRAQDLKTVPVCT